MIGQSEICYKLFNLLFKLFYNDHGKNSCKRISLYSKKVDVCCQHIIITKVVLIFFPLYHLFDFIMPIVRIHKLYSMNDMETMMVNMLVSEFFYSSHKMFVVCILS